MLRRVPRKTYNTLVQAIDLGKPEKVAEEALDTEGKPFLTWRITDPVFTVPWRPVPVEEREYDVFSLSEDSFDPEKDDKLPCES